MRESNQRFKGRNLTLYIFECTMSIMYLLIAYVLIFTEYFSDGIAGSFRLPLGILMGVYGIFRVYRAIKKLLDKDQ